MNFPVVIPELIMSDTRELARVVSAMSDEEFRLFYERTSRPLWAYLSRLTGDSHKADDFLQEAYYRFYRAGARYESEAHRRNSLFQIATNVVRDAARRSKRYEEVPLEDDPAFETLPTSSVPVVDRAAASKIDLTRAMQKLEPAQREMLWLAYAQGASHEEIAEVVGVRAISVRTLLLRARRKLASILTASVSESQESQR